MNILLPIDGSDYTKRMLAYLAANNELLGAGHRYTLFTAVPPIPPHAARYIDRQTLERYYADQAEPVLRTSEAFARQQGWDIHTAFEAVHAASGIASYASAHDFDLIVMGTHGHSALGNVVLGSVTTGVLARCKVPVLLIR